MSDSSRRPIQPTDLYRLRAVGGVALHPADGSVVHAITWPDEQSDANRSQLHVQHRDLPGPSSHQITYGHHDSGARFSPSGERLAFVRRTPKEPARLMLLDWADRQITEVATFADGMADLAWIDNRRLAVLVPRRPDDQVDVDAEELGRRPRIMTRLNYRFNGRDWTHDRPRQPAVVDLAANPATTTYLADGSEAPGYDLVSVDHGAIAVSPDGLMLAVTAASDDDADLTGTNHVWVHQLNGTGPARRLTDPGGIWRALAWHPEGPIVAVGTTDASTHGFSRPHLLDPQRGGSRPSDGAANTAARVLGPHDVNANPIIAVTGGLVTVNGAVLLSGPRQGAVTIDRYHLDDGTITTLGRPDQQILAFDASPDGSRIVASVTSIDRPAELWELTPDGQTKLVSLNNDILAELDLATTETVSVTGADGTNVEAFITRPPASVVAATPATGWPGLVYVHGGPMSQYGYSFFDEFQMAAAEGFVVIAGNPRGSDGYGEAWAQSLVGRLGTIDWDDVTALTDHLAALPEVDGTRLGIGGGSYGGFMASWAIGHTDRYRAALVERAVTSWPSMSGTSDVGPPFVPALTGASVESDLDLLVRQSPLTYAAAITTPTLIIHSEHDWRCPIEQAEQLFAAIRRNGGDATLVRFPGENHELSRGGSPRHRIERLDIVHEFFHRHLD